LAAVAAKEKQRRRQVLYIDVMRRPQLRAAGAAGIGYSYDVAAAKSGDGGWYYVYGVLGFGGSGS
jgi:hypothetical protein